MDQANYMKNLVNTVHVQLVYTLYTVHYAHKVSLDNFIFSGGEFRRNVLIQKSYMYEV